MRHTVYYILLLLCIALPITDKDKKAKQLYVQGRELRSTGDTYSAMQCFLEAIETGSTDTIMGRVYANIANICRGAEEHSLALAYYQKSAYYFLLNGDTLNYNYALNNQAWEWAVTEQKDSALYILNQINGNPVHNKQWETYAALYYSLHQYDSAQVYLDSLLSQGYDEVYGKLLKAQIFYQQGILDSAIYYAQVVYNQTVALSDKDNALYIIMNGDTTLSNEQILSLASERADIEKQIEEQGRNLSQSLVLLQQERKPNKSLGKWLIAILSFFLISLLCAGAVVYYRRYMRYSRISSKRYAEIERYAEILRDSRTLLTDISWNDYSQLCNFINQRFYLIIDKLQSMTSLTENEVRLCVLVLIRIPQKQMADMLNYSPSSIGRIKDNTAHKFGIKGGQLRQFMIDLIVKE